MYGTATEVPSEEHAEEAGFTDEVVDTVRAPWSGCDLDSSSRTSRAEVGLIIIALRQRR